MATLNLLKWSLQQEFEAPTWQDPMPLEDSQYDEGFKILLQGQSAYQDFIVPQLSQLLTSVLKSRVTVSVLEVGPGPKSVLGSLPSHLRRRIHRYAAFEPNAVFATRLQTWLSSSQESPLPCLDNQPDIHRTPFSLNTKTAVDPSGKEDGSAETFDLIMFCHSMYGMNPERDYIERALQMLNKKPDEGLIVVFHRDGAQFDGLVCHQTVSLPTGVTSVADDDETLDSFAQFIAGSGPKSFNGEWIDRQWREVCRALAHCDENRPKCLLYSSPDIMMAFTQRATRLPELLAEVSEASKEHRVKNREALVHYPASVVAPADIGDVQTCLTVISGGHGGQCLWPNVVALDMCAFNQILVLAKEEDNGKSPNTLVVVGAGCRSGDIIRNTMAADVTVPLGSRPSVGMGLVLQGGIGHLARQHGLASDSIAGAVVVSVATGQVLCVGNVPSQHQPADAVRLENDGDLRWALQGAGSNFGIVISVVLKACPAPEYTVRNCVIPLIDHAQAQLKLTDFNEEIAEKLPRHCSADAYLYHEAGKLHLGVNTFEVSTRDAIEPPPDTTALLGPEASSKTVDGVALFDTEMYMSAMHGGHGGGKTSSFKRCVFLKDIGSAGLTDKLLSAIESRPTPRCYLHLLHGGGAVRDIAPEATAFGCRDWDFACVITGVWQRDQDGRQEARAAMQWVYDVANDLLPLCAGVYGADLGPDPRDATLAAKAFGPDHARLAIAKETFDPHNVLAYACLLPAVERAQRLIGLVTGHSGVGKDFTAVVWMHECNTAGFSTAIVSISDSTKREYANATGADIQRLFEDRTYNEQHRPALLKYYQTQVQTRPRLPEEHFLEAVGRAGDLDVLFITGMRDDALVAAFSHLVPDSRVIEVRVEADEAARLVWGSNQDSNTHAADALNNCPTFTFHNNIVDAAGVQSAQAFCSNHFLPFLHPNLQRLRTMIHSTPKFPHPNITFRDILGLTQQTGGLKLCTSLLQSHFSGDWSTVSAIVCCESGGFLFASALAAQLDIPLALIREAGKIPPPTVSVAKGGSYISSSGTNSAEGKKVEMSREAVANGSKVVVVDDVLASGETVCAVLQLLKGGGS
ncbi:uncharacterized protein LTR77_006900 [Saxophila tyrrhenica]|uniref:FAD-binding PCMH-type domain-containing protein n=1 Tax=Saxophila tyrrhenica TaxID=1690608 RepID=A0AAV9PA95_9PEZI|nr:hypothetical protein LTR77_006900 [Saxophila tyrrhenica]